MAIRIERHEAQALTRVTLDRGGKGNSLSADMVADLAVVVDNCYGDGTRVLLFDADGANFCTGFDLSGLDDEDDDSLLARFVRVELFLQRIHRAPFLTIAYAQGKAWGTGADLFAACSQRWVCDDASFTFPGSAFGLILGTGRLAARVGSAQAEEWVVCGSRVDAAAALAVGLATRRLSGPGKEVLGTALALAESTARVDLITLAALRNAASTHGHDEDADDLAQLVRSAARPGLRDRIRAYRAASVQKRPAAM